MKKRKMMWYGHVTRSGLAKTILQGTVLQKTKWQAEKKRWEDNIQDETGMSFAESVVPLQPPHLKL